MPVPWLGVLDAILGLADMARRINRRQAVALRDTGESVAGSSRTGGAGGPLETRMAGVVVAALKEAFDRDSQRLQLEREQRDADRQRADRMLRIELTRQAGEHELAQLRLMTGVAAGGWLATMLIAALGPLGLSSRITFGLGWLLLVAALATGLLGQSRVSSGLARLADRDETARPGAGDAAIATLWLIVAGLSAMAVGMLLR